MIIFAVMAGAIAPALIFVPAIVEMRREGRREEAARNEREREERERAFQAEKERRGEVVRRIVYKAYKGMLDQHAHGLHHLTPIISRFKVGCPAEVARYALELTYNELERFDRRPILKALDELNAIEI